MSNGPFAEILSIIEKAKSLGFRVLENGTQLVGAVPHVAPEAYIHKVFAPLSENQILYLEGAVLKRSIPASYKELLAHCNGLSLFSGSLSLDGYRKSYTRHGDEVWQPFAIETPNLIERPADAERDAFFVGGYKADGSVLYILEGKAYRSPRRSAKPLNEWNNFWEMLLSETRRLAELFDETGRKTNPNLPVTP